MNAEFEKKHKECKAPGMRKDMSRIKPNPDSPRCNRLGDWLTRVHTLSERTCKSPGHMTGSERCALPASDHMPAFPIAANSLDSPAAADGRLCVDSAVPDFGP